MGGGRCTCTPPPPPLRTRLDCKFKFLKLLKVLLLIKIGFSTSCLTLRDISEPGTKKRTFFEVEGLDLGIRRMFTVRDDEFLLLPTESYEMWLLLVEKGPIGLVVFRILIWHT